MSAFLRGPVTLRGASLPPPSDPWRLRALACAPLLPDPAAPAGLFLQPRHAALPALLGGLEAGQRAALPGLLLSQDLAPLWQPLWRKRPALAAEYQELAAACDAAATAAAARYLLQGHVTRQAESALARAGIPWCRIKGAHVRELLYPEPFRRPADDVDLLIAPADRPAALAALTGAGFDYRSKAANLTHEATLTRSGAAIDLHWEVLRPARLREPLAATLVGSRRWFARGAGGHFGPEDTLHLVLLLIHPVFTKYATSPQARLVRAVDLAWWLTLRPPDWDAVIGALDRLGLRVAAWITLWGLARLTDRAMAPAAVLAALAPGRWRQRYLAAWLRHDLPGRWYHRPALVQLGFTLPAQDAAADAWRMLRGRGRPASAHRPKGS